MLGDKMGILMEEEVESLKKKVSQKENSSYNDNNNYWKNMCNTFLHIQTYFSTSSLLPNQISTYSSTSEFSCALVCALNSTTARLLVPIPNLSFLFQRVFSVVFFSPAPKGLLQPQVPIRAQISAPLPYNGNSKFSKLLGLPKAIITTSLQSPM